ncbi:integrase core domain-containing protein [Rhodoferax sp.]|uniref:integrase core domain-containing protein n=1 Tax=Rhodoferax sp. TaxID=50421 RepID=UPI00271F444D|nr:integrase core domain-containing protein [Rhodoferax sp.]MDO9198333.1 integrase core domain-containing protein [Rhodoferax sp.]
MWKTSCVAEEKLRFIARRLEAGETMAELCEAFGISRQAGYELMARYGRDGPSCVQPRSRARLTQAGAVGLVVAEALVELRLRRPYWGPKKLLAYLGRTRPELALPATSTAGDLLKRAGLVTGRRRRRSALPLTRPFAAVNAPGDLWCIDFKGWFRTGDGQRCDPLTVTDAHSRYLLACQIVPPTHEGVFQVTERLFKEFGVPWALRSDNGPPFASTGAAGLTRLSAHWLKLGITLERIEPGKPQQNGRHERMHATLKARTAQPPAADPKAQQRRFDAFRREFNLVRPHEALNQATPASLFRRAPRQYPTHLPELIYDDDHEVRRVRSNGCIKWRGEMVFVSEALVGEPVGIAQTPAGAYNVSFASMDIGLIDPAGKTMRRFTSPRPGRGEAGHEQTRKTVTHVTGS